VEQVIESEGRTVRRLPDPELCPTIPLWPDTGQVLGLRRSATYGAAERGEIPVLRLGRRLVVPTAPLRAMLGLDAARPSPEHSVVSDPATGSVACRATVPMAESGGPDVA
jgi:hypothetical protein